MNTVVKLGLSSLKKVRNGIIDCLSDLKIIYSACLGMKRVVHTDVVRSYVRVRVVAHVTATVRRVCCSRSTRRDGSRIVLLQQPENDKQMYVVVSLVYMHFLPCSLM